MLPFCLALDVRSCRSVDCLSGEWTDIVLFVWCSTVHDVIERGQMGCSLHVFANESQLASNSRSPQESMLSNMLLVSLSIFCLVGSRPFSICERCQNQRQRCTAAELTYMVLHPGVSIYCPQCRIYQNHALLFYSPGTHDTFVCQERQWTLNAAR